MTKLLNGFNPCGTDMNPAGDWRLQAFFLDRHPGFDQRVVWTSPDDCSVLERDVVHHVREVIKKYDSDPAQAREAACEMLASFDPIETVKTLHKRGVPRDFDGIIGVDHEIPAWMSCLHFRVYFSIVEAISGAFPYAKVREYAGTPCDWVRDYSKPDRSHEIAAMRSLASSCGSPIIPMPSAYVPGLEYTNDLAEFKRRLLKNVEFWYSTGYPGMIDVIAVSPFIEGTQKTPGDYTSGELVPVEAMTIIVKAINSIGAATCIWGAGYDERQGNRFVEAVEQVMIPAVEAAEKGDGDGK